MRRWSTWMMLWAGPWMWTACWTPGADGADGADGAAGASTAALVVSTAPAEPGACEGDGTTVWMGHDVDGDGRLDVAADADQDDATTADVDERDVDGDGNRDVDEREQSFTLCDGATGATGSSGDLVELWEGIPGEGYCEESDTGSAGLTADVLAWGADDDGDGVLDPDEVEDWYALRCWQVWSGDTGDTGATSDGSCTTWVRTTPLQGAVDAYYRGNLEFRLSAPDATATVSTDIPGFQRVSDDGRTVTWVLREPLAPNTAYSAALTYCGGEEVLNFRTSDLGAPVTDPSGLAGGVYAFSLADARIVEPAGIGGVFASWFTQTMLFGVESTQAGALTALLGVAGEGSDTQDYCGTTNAFEGVPFEDPYFELPEQDVVMTVAGATSVMERFVLTGTFASDGSAFGGGTMRYSVDTRPLAPLLDDSGNVGAICDLSASFGVACEPCADGEPYCLTFVADQFTGVRTPGPSLVRLDQACDPSTCANYTADSFLGVTPGECPSI